MPDLHTTMSARTFLSDDGQISHSPAVPEISQIETRFANSEGLYHDPIKRIAAGWNGASKNATKKRKAYLVVSVSLVTSMIGVIHICSVLLAPACAKVNAIPPISQDASKIDGRIFDANMLAGICRTQ
jgi:hypothetical protein